ncbi:MAG: Tol-Pal system beta propeller repeat protein TolB [Pseudomonadota bacterium]
MNTTHFSLEGIPGRRSGVTPLALFAQFLICVCAVAAACGPSVARAESLDTVVIDAGYDKQTKIAVVPFRVDPRVPAGAPMEGIIEFDLQRSGQFEVLPAANMLSLPSRPSEVIFRDWKILGMEYLLIGRVAPTSSGQALYVYLFDVVNERQLAGRRIEGSRETWRDSAHLVADLVYEQVTGIPGAFSTKLMYVLARNLGTRSTSFRLEIADSDGERLRTLYESSEPILSATWSPDGAQIAYVSFDLGRPAVYLHDIASNQRELIADFPGNNSAPAFSPDGRQLALVLSKDGNPEIYVMDLATRALRRLTTNRAIDTEPVFSPDGRTLAFTSDRGGRPQVYALDPATGAVNGRLTYEGDYNARAQYLPTGKQMVFVHRRRGVFHIAWQSLEREDFRILTQTRLDESPSVAPNGAMLIYATQYQGQGILAVVSLDGRVKYRLPSSNGEVREPAWSPFLPAVVTAQPLP